MITKPTLAALAASLIFAGCGGSSSDKEQTIVKQQPKTYSLGGKVIDGYVSGATVWIDFNNNGSYDADEPKVMSGDAGNYALELTASQRQCAQYSTLYVDVPVGAIDEDLGEVTEAYQMVRPPVLEVITDESLLHISPLTTALWQGIETELNGSTFSDCNTLVADQAKRQDLKKLIEDTLYNTVSFYNISEEEIFQDFIAEGNEESKEFAQKFVRGLQKSFSYTLEVENANPTATEVRVVHYFGKNAYYTDDQEAHWFRDVMVSEGMSYYSRVDLVSDTLEEIVQPIYYRDEVNSAWNEGALISTNDVIYRGKENGFGCSLSERVNVTESGVKYELSNTLPDEQYVASGDDCQTAVFSDSIPNRTFYIRYAENNKSYLADIRQLGGTVTVLPHWVDFAGRSEAFDFTELVAQLQDSGYQYAEELLIPSNYWSKREEWYEGDIYHQISYNHLGQWSKYTRLADGTHTDQCSYDEGQTWQACAQQ